MSEPSWLNVCEPEVAAALSGDAFSGPLEQLQSSPLDDYYGYVEHLLTLGHSAALAASPALGRLLLLGLVGAAEAYFRSVITGVLRLCPVCRANAADQLIPFGAIDYYGSSEVEYGLFDASSLAGAAEIRKRTQNLLGITVKDGSSTAAALAEFDKVCHLRHAAVHARGTLGRGNAAALGLGSSYGRRTLAVTFGNLQDAGLVCHSAVRAYNRFLYQAVVGRWVGQSVLSGTWASDKDRFAPLFELFRSKKDGVGPVNAYQAYRSLAAAVL